MLRKVVETVVAGAIGLGALYGVALLAYSAGHEMAELEQRYDEVVEQDQKKPVEEKPRKVGKLGLLFRLKKMFGGKKSVLGDLANNPEDHRLEAYVKEGELHINIKKTSREKSTPLYGTQ